MYCLSNFLGARFPGRDILGVAFMRRTDMSLVQNIGRKRVQLGTIQFDQNNVKLFDNNLYGDHVLHFKREIFDELYCNDAPTYELFEASSTIRATRVYKDFEFVHGFGTIPNRDEDTRFCYKIPSGNIIIKIWFN